MKRFSRLFICVLLSVLVFGCSKKTTENTGIPEIYNLSKDIAAPQPGDHVTVSATVMAPEGTALSSVELSWTVNGANPSKVEMYGVGADNVYAGVIPGQTDGAEVSYTVSAANKNGVAKESDSYTVRQNQTAYSPLVLNEINGNGNDADKYIELYNNSAEAINLNGVTIYYNNLSEEPEVTWFGVEQFIAPKSFVLLKGTKYTGDMIKGLSATQGIIVEMVDPDGNRLDIFRIDEDMNRQNAYSRIPDGVGKWYLTPFAGTQGATNGTSAAGLTAIPTLPIITGFSRDVLIPTVTDAVNISATVKAFSGTFLSSVVLKWTLGGVAQPNIHAAKKGDVYSATIGAQAAGSVVVYTVSATGSDDKSAEVSAGYTVVSEPVNYHNLVINEIDGNHKFVELYNKGNAAIPLDQVYLVKNDQANNWWTGKAGAVIQPKGYYAVAQTTEGSNINPDPPANASEYTGINGISCSQNVKFELRTPDKTLLDSFLRMKEGGALSDRITPDYSSGTKYSFSRCPDGTGAFGLAPPSCNAANPATAVGPILAQ